MPGDTLLLRYGKVGHVAYIISMSSKGYLISEANYYRCKTSVRTIAFDDSHIIGIKGFGLRPQYVDLSV